MLGCVVLLLAGNAALADSTPAATEWLDKLAAVYERTPLEFAYQADLRVSQMGEMTDVKVSGRSTQGGAGKMRVEATMEMPVPGSETKSSLRMIGVSDGAVLWIEMDNPLTGARQAMKISLDKMEKLAASNPLAKNLSKMDPLAQIAEAAKLFDFDVASRGPETVTLKAKLTGEALERAKVTFEGVDPSLMEHLTLVLDSETAFPEEIRLGSDTASALAMKFFDLEFPQAVDAGTFAYTPPEGMAVVDLGALIDAGTGGNP
jgi:outer membrane lipoprotein-sorting protein